MHTVILSGPKQREFAHKLIQSAPPGAKVTVAGPKRTISQNSRFWAMLSEISAAKPGGKFYTPEVWKALFMSALGHELRLIEGLNGEPFPVGFHSSNLTVKQMIDMQEFMAAWAAQNSITLTSKDEEDRQQ